MSITELNTMFSKRIKSSRRCVRNETSLLKTVCIVTCVFAFVITGCAGADHGSRTDQFSLRFERTEKGTEVSYLVLEEKRQISNYSEGDYQVSQLKWCRLNKSTVETVTCDIPELKRRFRINPLMFHDFKVESDQEYRFTILSPGFVATTIYPEGAHNGSRKEEPPGLFEHADATSGFGTFMGIRTELEKPSNGSPPIITIKSIQSIGKENCGENGAIGVFRAQVNCIADAISRGLLSTTAMDHRSMTYSALLSQREELEQIRVDGHGCIPDSANRAIDADLERIQQWATIKSIVGGRHSSATPPKTAKGENCKGDVPHFYRLIPSIAASSETLPLSSAFGVSTQALSPKPREA